MNAKILMLALLLFFITRTTVSDNDRAWTLENGYIKIVVSKHDGLINSLTMNGRSLIDHPVSVWIDGDEQNPVTVTRGALDQDPNQLTVNCSYRPYYITHTYSLDTLNLNWTMKIKAMNNTSADRVEAKMPLARDLTETFFANGRLVNSADMNNKIALYRRDTPLPLITVYGPDQGLTVFIPPDRVVPGLSFSLINGNLSIVFDKISIITSNPLEIELDLAPHRGGWRAGLNALTAKYPGYFHPAMAGIHEGMFYLGTSFEDEPVIRGLTAKGVSWTELHGHFPFYGLYAPAANNWGLITDSDKTSLGAWERGEGKDRNSYLRMNQQIDLWHENGIQTFLYFQPFEAWHQYSEKYFPSDIAKDRGGNNLPAWQYCTLMNPDPASPWGRHIISQAHRLLEKYPTIDGIFWDRMDYCFYDFAHDDGITMVDGKSAYMLGFALEKMNDTIFKIFHNRGKAVWGNGPTSLEVCKNLDGIMAEGSLTNLYKIQYLGLVRPIVYLPYDKTPDETEEKLKNCLLCGAFPAVTYGDSTCHGLDHRYRTLFETLKKREWVLSPNPILVPSKFKANIFRLAGGDYAAVVISPEKSQLYDTYEYNIPITLDLPDAKTITRAYLISGDWPGVKELKLNKKNTHINLVIPYHLTNSMVILTKGKSYQVTGAYIDPTAALGDISITPPKFIFIRSRDFEKIKIIVTNNTDRKQTLRFTSESLRDNGQILIPKTLILGAYETRVMDAQIKAVEGGSYRITARWGQKSFAREFSVKTGLTAASNALFRDDFSRSLEKWEVGQGKWETTAGIAGGVGPSHFAYILNNEWSNYRFQVETRIIGSDDPEVDWLKSYIFFRVQDDRNFYRFGIHGDAGVIDLFKCVNGSWFQLTSANFIPEPDTWYTLMVSIRGDRIEGFVDGKKVVETRDPTFSNGGIGIGVLEDAMRVQYREIIVNP